MGAYNCFVQYEFGSAWSRGQNFTGRKFYKILQGKKLNLNRYISVITNIDVTWFVIFEHTMNRLSFGYVRLPQLEYYFSSFASFFLLFLFYFFMPLSSFKPLNALHSKFKRLKISGRTYERQKSGVPCWADTLNRVFQNFELLNHYCQMNQIFGMGKY